METKYLRNTMKIVEQKLSQSLEQFFGLKGIVNVTPYNKTNDFQYQSPYALRYYKAIQKQTKKKFGNMGELVQFLKEELEKNYKDMFSKIDINSNFLLLALNENYLQEEVNKLLRNEIKVETSKKEKIVVDFSSPNIAKEMHVGHLRSTIMGESLCRILEFLDNDVVRVNHLGDWGTQFEYPNYLEQTPNLKDLETFYKASKRKFDEDPDFKKKAQLKVVDLQQGDEACKKAWEVLCEISRKFFVEIYKRLGVTNNEYGESYYKELIPDVISELKSKDLVKMDEGALCMFLPPKNKKQKRVPLMLVKSDGGYNYDTTDMAAARLRLVDWKADRLVYITDLGQESHFLAIFKGAEMAGWHTPPKTRMQHMGFGIVLGDDGKRMKTRSGKTVKLMGLLDEAKEKAKDQLMQRFNSDDVNGFKTQLDEDEIDNAAEILGVASIKYYDLKQKRNENYQFNPDEMLSQKGDTAVYLMYSYTRICSILRKSKFNEEDLKKDNFEFTDEYEKVLAGHLVQFSETIDYVVSDKLAINFLCSYLYGLSTKVASGYKKYKIINNEHSLNRVKLIYCIKKIMEKCFYLLGIETINKI